MIRWSGRATSEPGTKGLRKVYESGVRKGNMSALKGNQETAIGGKPVYSVQEETSAVSATEIIVDNQHNRPLLLHDRRHKMTEEDLRKETLLGELVSPEREVKDRYLKGNCTNPSYDYWHPPVRQNYKTESRCKFGDKCPFRHTEGWMKMVGWFFEMLLLSAKCSRSLGRWEKHFVTGDLESRSKALSFRLAPWLNITVFLRKTSQGSINLVRHFLLVYSLDMHCMRGEFGQETFWSQTVGSWKIYTRQKSMLEDSMQRKYSRRKMVNIFKFPIVDGTVTLSGRDHGIQKSTLMRHHLVRSEDLREDLQGNPGTCKPRTKQKMTQKPVTIFGQSKGISLIVIMSDLEVSSTCRKKKRSQFHWRALMCPDELTQIWMWCKKTVLTIVGTLMWIEVCQIRGQDSRRLHYCTNQQDFCGTGSSLHNFKQLPDLIMCGQKFGPACRKQLNERKSINGLSTNPSSTMRGSWEAFISSIRMMESTRKPLKTQGRCGRYRWRRLCFASWGGRSVPTSCGKPTTRPKNTTTSKSKDMHASWRLMNSRESGSNLLHQKIMKITSQREGSIRWITVTWCASLFPCPKRWEFWMRKKQWTKICRSSKRLFWKHKKEEKNSPFCYIDGHLSSPKCGAGYPK